MIRNVIAGSRDAPTLAPPPDGQLKLDGLGVCQVRFGSLQKPLLQRSAIAREPRMQPVLERGINFQDDASALAPHPARNVTRMT